MTQPIIGITGRPFAVKASGGERIAHGVIADYCQGVLASGGLPVMLPQQDPEDAQRILAVVDGLVFTGGGDVDPRTYGADPGKSLGVNTERDAWEIALAHAASKQHLPTLAICRGLQVLNVAFGGTLWVDIPTQCADAEEHNVTDERAFVGHQRVRIDTDSKLATILGAETTANSIHHQAVETIANGWRTVGWADDGIIEAIEPMNGDWPIVAVQWHPEYLPAGQPLFDWVVERAKQRVRS